MTRSLRRRLTLIVSALSVLAWSVSAVLQWRQLADEVGALFDAHIAAAAQTFYGLASHELYEHAVEEKDEEPRVIEHDVFTELSTQVDAEYARDHIFQVIVGDDRVVMRSPAAPATPLTRSTTTGFGEAMIEGQPWRLFNLRGGWARGTLGVVVAEPRAVRLRVENHLAWQLGAPLLVALPVLLGAIWGGLRWGLEPLHRAVTEVRRRDANNLAPLVVGEAPREVLPLIDALDSLLARLASALDSERRFTADAAHELRTPLAGIRMQAQVAQRSADERARRHALDQVVQGVDRATHLVNQLLTLERLDPEFSAGALATVDLANLARNAVEAAAKDARTRELSLVCEASPPARVAGNVELLAIALRNLIDNALRYTPPQGQVTVRVEAAPDGALVLEVDDSGPGIPEAQRADALRRFHRLPGTTANGSGIGLSIVHRVAELHHAAFELDRAPQGGLRARLRFAPTA